MNNWFSPAFHRENGEPAPYRLTGLWVFFLIWSLLLFFRLTQIMAWERDQYLLAPGPEAGWRYELVPAARGRILDASGQALAWSSRLFALDWQVPAEPARAEHEWELIISAAVPDRHWSRARALARGDTRIRLKQFLEPGEFADIQPLLAGLPSLRVSAYFVRRRVRHPGLRARLGEVIFEEAMEIGYSGWEKQHDGLLRGSPALLRVRLDQAGRPIPGTREIVRDMRNGYDIYLPFTVDPELLNN